MANPESKFGHQPPQEPLDPHHFYAAYGFDQPETHKYDIITLVEEAYRLNYPVRYWWLSDAMDLQGTPDRLIICVHHPRGDEEAGMDLFEALKERRVVWDGLGAAAVDEYRQLSQPITGPKGVCWPDGRALFPLEESNQRAFLSPQPPPKAAETQAKDYDVFYSLSGLMAVSALSENEASEAVFGALHSLVGKSRSQGITAQEADEVCLYDALVEIDLVKEAKPENWSLGVTHKPNNVVLVRLTHPEEIEPEVKAKVHPLDSGWMECFDSEETGHLCNAVKVSQGIDQEGQLYEQREWDLGAHGPPVPKSFIPHEWQPAFLPEWGIDLDFVLVQLELLVENDALSPEEHTRSEDFYRRLFSDKPPQS